MRRWLILVRLGGLLFAAANASPAWAAACSSTSYGTGWTCVQQSQTYCANAGSCATTMPGNITNGHILLMFCTDNNFDTMALPTITSGTGTIATAVANGSTTGGGGQEDAGWYAYVTGTGSATVSCNTSGGSGSYFNFYVVEYAGEVASSPLDVTLAWTNGTNATTITAGTVTTTVSNDMITCYAATVFQSGTSISGAGTNFTLIDDGGSGSNYVWGAELYAPSGTYSAAPTMTGSGLGSGWNVGCTAIKPSGGAAAPTVMPPRVIGAAIQKNRPDGDADIDEPYRFARRRMAA